jgi:predicted Zn-dependent peptidase
MKHTVTEIKLKNGAKGLLIHVPDASVMYFELNFRAGDYLAEPKRWETPHLMEHVLLGANQLHPKARLFQAQFQKNGAYCNASTGSYGITYEAECAEFEWDRIFDLLLIAITKPLFLQEEFDAEFGNVREELQSLSNSHFRHLSLALHEKYGFVAKTDQERLKLMNNVRLADVRQHYKKTHMSRNLRFIVAGNLTPKRQEALVETLNAIDLPEGTERLELPNETPKRQEEPLYIRDRSVKNIYFYVDSFMKRRMTDTETDALGLANTMLTETLNSKIFGAARERGLVYDMSSGFGQTKKGSNWSFAAQVSRTNAPALFNLMKRELQNMFDGAISAEDIEMAKAYSLGRFQCSAQTVRGTASGYSHRYFFDEIIDDYYQIPKRIRAVNKTRIVDITRSLFAEQVWGLGMLSNCERELGEELQARIAPLWQPTGS